MKAKKDKGYASCDFKPARPVRAASGPAKARIMRHRADFSWSGVRTERYKTPDGTWSRVLRRTLVGHRGEKTRFHVRYFEVAPGGLTSHERHRHEHVVTCVRGRGRCRVGFKTYELGFLDTIYIPPGVPHRLFNPYEEPFGFLCVVDAKRDAPKTIPQ